MKIQLTIDQPTRDGYFYASPLNPDENIAKDFLDLGKFAHACQCSHIYAPEIIDALTFEDIQTHLAKWVNLLEPNGKILIGGTDAYLLAKSIISRELSMGQINSLLFRRPYFIRAITSVEYIKGIFLQMGLEISNISIDYSVSSFIVEATKTNV